MCVCVVSDKMIFEMFYIVWEEMVCVCVCGGGGGGGGGWCLTKARSHGAFVFFFLALLAKSRMV